MVIKGNGRVGIGTTSPTSTLDIRGDINLGSSGTLKLEAGSFGAASLLLSSNGGYYFTLDANNNNGATDNFSIVDCGGNSYFYVKRSSGNVGIEQQLQMPRRFSILLQPQKVSERRP